MSVGLAFLGLFGVALFIAGIFGLLLAVIPALRQRGKWIRNSVILTVVGLLVVIPSYALDAREGEQAATPTTAAPSDAAAFESASVTQAAQPDPTTPAEANITITSDPAGARVYFEGDDLQGVTPVTVTIPANQDVAYRVVVPESGPEPDLYKPFAGTLNFGTDDGVSIWLERTSEEEQEAQRLATEERRLEVERSAEEARLAQERSRITQRLEDTEFTVRDTCHDIVRRNLKAPSTAKFPGIFSGEWSYRPDPESGTAFYIAHVDAQNSFGAMLRNDFMCSYSLETNQVKLEYFE